MPFNKNALELLKIDFTNPLYKSGNYKPDAGVLEGIIARMEAAEDYARYGDLLHGGKSAECVLDKCDMCLAKKAWRKSKGE